MTDRTIIFAADMERGVRAIGELGLDRQRTCVVTPRNGCRAARGCDVDRIVLIDNAYPESPEIRESLLAAVSLSDKPQVFTWQRSEL